MSTGTSRIYLDYNATAPVKPKALAAACEAIEGGGNASSVHGEGRRARQRIEVARAQVAALVGAEATGVCFTSGGTEAANLALRSIAFSDGTPASRLIVGAGEHAAVLLGHAFCADTVETIPLRPSGVVDLDRLSEALRRRGPAVLALQAANNETGVLQPTEAAARMVHAAGGILVCDAVQAAGRVPCGADALGADVVLLSGHKLGGLQGAGAVVTMSDRVRLSALVRGGGQERGLRGGTENVPAIAAFGAVAEEARALADADRLRALRDLFEAELRAGVPEAMIFGAQAPRLPNTSAVSIPGIAAERLMMALDLAGIAVSSGSACASGKVGRSHVLEAMGVEPDLRQGMIRVSFGWRSAVADVEAMMTALNAALGRMRRPQRFAA